MPPPGYFKFLLLTALVVLPTSHSFLFTHSFAAKSLPHQPKVRVDLAHFNAVFDSECLPMRRSQFPNEAACGICSRPSTVCKAASS